MHGASAARASRARAPLLTLLLPVIRSLVTSLENIQYIVQSDMVRIGALQYSASLFSEQTEAQRAKKNILETAPFPPYLRVWMITPASYLNVWIRHCNKLKFFYLINVQ